jgi:hypothetical protein
MATITSANSSSYENTSRRSYITSAPFNLDFWSYTTSVDPTTYVTTGTLTTVSGATAANCPYSRVLRETGRKLVPGANPGITVYMVEVFDNVSFLRGYINPNSPIFAPFNSDKPAFMEEPYVLNQDVSGGSYGTPGNFAGTQNLGSSVVTRGNALIDGYIETGGQIRCLQQTVLEQITTNNQQLTIDPILGQTFYVYIGNNGGGAFTTTLNLTGSTFSIGDRVTIYAKLRAGPTPGTCTLSFTSDFQTQGNLVNSVSGTTSVYTLTFQALDTTGANPPGPANKLVELSRTIALV